MCACVVDTCLRLSNKCDTVYNSTESLIHDLLLCDSTDLSLCKNISHIHSMHVSWRLCDAFCVILNLVCVETIGCILDMNISKLGAGSNGHEEQSTSCLQFNFQ